MDSRRQQIQFRLSCSAKCVYLVAKPETGGAIVMLMGEDSPHSWAQDVELPPGTYRFRYYSGDDQQVTYLGPAETDGTHTDDMDAVFAVPSQREISICPESLTRPIPGEGPFGFSGSRS